MFQILKGWQTCFEQGVTVKNTTGIVQKTMSKPFFSPCWVHMSALCCYSPVILFSHLFILWCGYLPSPCLSSTAGVPRENKPTPAGMEQSHNPLSLPLPSPTLSASSCPTVSLPICPASLPYDLVADKTRGPTVPSAWCQHFPLIQSQPCCVTDGLRWSKTAAQLKKQSENY